jgi:hypothetical protein
MSHALEMRDQSWRIACRRRLVWVLTKRSTLVWPRRFLFFAVDPCLNRPAVLARCCRGADRHEPHRRPLQSRPVREVVPAPLVLRPLPCLLRESKLVGEGALLPLSLAADDAVLVIHLPRVVQAAWSLQWSSVQTQASNRHPERGLSHWSSTQDQVDKLLRRLADGSIASDPRR